VPGRAGEGTKHLAKLKTPQMICVLDSIAEKQEQDKKPTKNPAI
jgi:hypothetical protein